MKIGIAAGATEGPDSTLDGLIELAQSLERAGFDQLWMASVFGLDALSALALVGRETERLRLGTAVVPTYPRHPLVMAQQALTAQVASGGRFELGIGLSHKVVIENMLGYSYDRPARHMREYLEVLAPLLRGESVRYRGEQYRVAAQLEVPGAAEVPLLVAALGPVMLELAGRLAAGTITWMVGPRTLAEYTGPTLRAAAEKAGRPEPRIVAGFPVAVTDDPDGARSRIAKALEIYGQLPSYRAMLDREGADGPADVAIVGPEKVVRDRVRALQDVGVSDFQAAIVGGEKGSRRRTLDLLQSLL